MKLDPKQLYTYLVQNGGTPNQAAMLTGMAGAESNYNPTLSHDSGTGYGLWGHRNERWRAMQQASGGVRNPDWQHQALYALQELNNRNLPTYQGLAAQKLAAARSPAEVTQAGMHFERPIGYTAANPAGGHNYAGRLSLVSQAMGGSPGMPSMATPGMMTMGTPPAPSEAQQSADPVPVDMTPPAPPEEDNTPDPYTPVAVADATDSPGGMDMSDLHDLMRAADMAGMGEQPDPSSMLVAQKAQMGRQRLAQMGDLQFDPYEPVVVGQAAQMPQFRVTKNG